MTVLQNAPYTIVNADNFSSVVGHLSSVRDTIGFDTETNSDGTLHFIQFYSPISGQSFIFLGDDPNISKLTSVWSNWNVVGHNIQFDLASCLRQYNSYPNPVADTFLLACSLQECEKGLKPLCNSYFGFPIVSWEELFGDYDYSNMTEDHWHYVANDPYYTYLLYEHYKQVGAYRFVKKVHTIDLKAMIHYMRASVDGLQIDQILFARYLEQYTQQVNDLQDKLDSYAGWEVKVTSTKDLKKLLFEQLQLPTPPLTTGTGDISVSKEALEYVPDKDGIVTLITKLKEARSIIASMKNL